MLTATVSHKVWPPERNLTLVNRKSPRLTREELAELRAVMLANNEIVMQEMERRGPPR